MPSMLEGKYFQFPVWKNDAYNIFCYQVFKYSIFLCMYFFQTVRLISIFTEFDVVDVLFLQLHLSEFRFQSKYKQSMGQSY